MTGGAEGKTASMAPATDVVVPDWGATQAPPEDQPRSEDVHDIKLGAVVQDADGRNWVFFGWRRNSAGLSAHFAMEERGYRQGESILYSAALAATLERKFPTLAGMRRA